ncbi:MAG: TolC family protein [candidate division Zixibacteria bacterium]|nr:TolC family protein [candidate division Zixibacteria bacterium]
MKTLTMAVVLILFMAAVGSAQEQLTLDKAIELALRDNHAVRVARNDARATKNTVNIGSAGLLPKVDFISTMNYRDEAASDAQGGANTTSTQNSASIQATYTLFDGFGNIFSFKKLKKTGVQAELQARNTIETVILQVSQAYYDVANSQEQLAIAEEALAISNDRLVRAKKQSQYGQANAVDVLSAEVDLNTDSTSLLNARLNQKEACRNLNVLLNRDLDTKFTVGTDVDYLDHPDRSEFHRSALANNAEYLSALNFLEQARLDLKGAYADFMPQVNVQMSYGYSQSSPDWRVNYDDPAKTYSAFVTLNFNIFNGFQNKIKTQNARLDVRNQEIYENEVRLDLQRLVANAYDAYANSLEVLALQERNLESARLNFKRTQDLYNLGQVTTTTFREAQLNLVRARNNISTAKYAAKLNELHLMKLGGRLVEADG